MGAPLPFTIRIHLVFSPFLAGPTTRPCLAGTKQDIFQYQVPSTDHKVLQQTS